MKTLDTRKLNYYDPEYEQFYEQLHELIDPEISAWDTLNGVDCEFGKMLEAEASESVDNE